MTFKFRTDYSSHWTHLHLLGWLRKKQLLSASTGFFGGLFFYWTGWNSPLRFRIIVSTGERKLIIHFFKKQIYPLGVAVAISARRNLSICQSRTFSVRREYFIKSFCCIGNFQKLPLLEKLWSQKLNANKGTIRSQRSYFGSLFKKRGACRTTCCM